MFRTCACSMDHSHPASQSVVLPSEVEPEQSVLLFSGRCLPAPGSPEHPGVYFVPVLLGTNTQNPTQGPRVDRDPIPSPLQRVHFEEKQGCFGVCEGFFFFFFLTFPEKTELSISEELKMTSVGDKSCLSPTLLSFSDSSQLRGSKMMKDKGPQNRERVNKRVTSSPGCFS